MEFRSCPACAVKLGQRASWQARVTICCAVRGTSGRLFQPLYILAYPLDLLHEMLARVVEIADLFFLRPLRLPLAAPPLVRPLRARIYLILVTLKLQRVEIAFAPLQELTQPFQKVA